MQRYLRLGWFLLGVSPWCMAQDPLLLDDRIPTHGSAFSASSVLPGMVDMSDEAPQLLPSEQAFTAAVQVRNARMLDTRLTAARGYYLYRDKIRFDLVSSTPIQVEKIVLPKGEIKSDPNFGDLEVFHGTVNGILTLKREKPDASRLSLVATYQGCSEQGVCYPPITQAFELFLPEVVSVAQRTHPGLPLKQGNKSQAGGAQLSTVDDPVMPQPSAEPDKVAGLFAQGNFWVLTAGFFSLGLLLSFTPCVLPMVPILSGIIVGHGEKITRLSAFVFSLSYVLGMAFTYASAGVAAGLSGTLLSHALQNPWTLGAFALLFVGLALAMFGLYELQMPSFLQSKLNDASNRVSRKSLAGLFAMGALSALIVGPCVAPPLAGALLHIGMTGDIVLGGAALFALALGMGVPLILVGMSAGEVLPKVGPWMASVNAFFGVVLLGVAIWIISPIIPVIAQMLLWAALLIISAMYLHALDPLPAGAGKGLRFWKGVGIIALISGIALLVGAYSGSRDILQPLTALRLASEGKTSAPRPDLPFYTVSTVAQLDDHLRQAAGTPVMVDFYAEWCVSCKELDRFTFSDPRVQEKLKTISLVRVDVTEGTMEQAALLKRFQLYGPPGIVFFDGNGNEIQSQRIIGYLDADRFLERLNSVLHGQEG